MPAKQLSTDRTTTSAISIVPSPSASRSDIALLTLGGALKRKEMISARLGDILAELYLLSAVLKRWQDEGRQADDFPLVAGCMASGFETIEARMEQVLANLPNRVAA